MKPKVSIICITYNHAPFIRQTLDSFLMQRAEFQFEVLIHDDASTDGTTEILREYEKEHPHVIKPVYEEKNQYSSGDYDFINDLFRAAKGKYIAFCEGDDFWTDEYKLQKQADFLDAHKDYALCFHPVRVFFENGEQPDSVYPELNDKRSFTVMNLLKSNFIQSNSVMYRRKTYEGIPSRIIPSDWYMHLYHALDGKIGFINDVMSAYRRQAGGVWWDTFKNVDLIWKKYGLQHLELYIELKKLYGMKEQANAILDAHIDAILKSFWRTDAQHGTSLISDAVVKFPLPLANALARLITQEQKLAKHLTDKAEQVEQLEVELAKEKDTLHHRELELRRIKESKLWRLRNLFARKN